MADDRCHVQDTHPPLNLGLRQVQRRVLVQLGHIQVSVKVWYAENLLPTELQLEFLQLNVEVQMNE
jgi:hypothetical protein